MSLLTNIALMLLSPTLCLHPCLRPCLLQLGAGNGVLFLADGNGDFTKAMDLELDGRGFGLGSRSQRYAAVIEDGVVSGTADV